MKHTLAMLAAGSFSVAAISVAAAQHAAVTDQELMDKLKDAAPAAVLKGATVLNMSADGQMKAIQAGTNGWTCMDPEDVRRQGRHGMGEGLEVEGTSAAKARLHLHA